ncbi:MAG TPA: ABC transporter ATP-binding protein [Myxococcota bacterium]|nr:ABC transporter ATP-binding protein [Myxococcota bacterium]
MSAADPRAARTAASTPVLSIERVGKRYREVVAVDDMSLEIGRGEFFSLLGPSGCGKTTMLRMIAGFEEPTSGVLRLDGRDVAGVPPYRRPVNTVFQNYALFPHLSVFENVAFGPRIRKLAEAELTRLVREMLDVVRLGDLAARRPSQLSGGQRQRVALARALVNGPLALLLDEPLSALDLELRRQMRLELKRIQREVGITFVFVTHDQEEALSLSDRMVVMRAGRVEQVGTPEEIYGRPETAFVARFIGSANLISVRVEETRNGRTSLRLPGDRRADVDPGGRRFANGDDALLMVRPEDLALDSKEPGTGWASLPVTCTDLVFQGAVVRCALADCAGNELVVHLGPHDQTPEVRHGASLWLRWRPDSARLLHRDEG